ncbi:MAG: penicillin-binding protein 2 [Patescibacteria group bacterium]
MTFEDDGYIAEYDPAEFFGRATAATPFMVASWVMIVVFLIAFGRLVDLQIVKGAKNFFLAEGNRVRETPIIAPRGIFLDRSGEPIIKNVVRYSLAVIPADLPRDKDSRDSILTKIADATSIKRSQIDGQFKDVNRASFDPVTVADNLNKEDALRLEIFFGEQPGVIIQKIPTRQYEDAGFAHLVGTIGKISKPELLKRPDYRITDWIGKSGLELVYEDKLRGHHGGTKVEVNAKGSVVRLIGEVRPERGEDLRLTVDRNLQKAGMEALAKVAPKGGALVAMNPKTGEILALGSFPEFDANAIIGGDEPTITSVFNDARRPLINRAIAAAFPSGSTIKPLWATAALSEHTITENTKLDTSAGSIRIGEFVFEDWKTHVTSDVRQAIAESNNIFFYAVAGGYQNIKGLGPDKMNEWAKRFGLGADTGIDLPGEVAGFVPSAEWKKRTTGERWFVGDSYNLGIGQGNLLITPLQLTRAVAAITTGKLARPYILSGTQAEFKELDARPEVLATVREGMRLAVTSGSGRQLSDFKDKNGSPVEAAAKTGTAQAGKGDKTHGWMVAFAPYRDPEIVVVAFAEEGGEGHATAGPVIKAMLEQWFKR